MDNQLVYEEVIIEENYENIEPAAPKRRRRRIQYREVSRFTDEAAFDQWMKTTATEWTRQHGGQGTQNYSCKFSKRKGYDCKATLRVIRPPANSNLICVEQSEDPHTHEPIVPLLGPLKLTQLLDDYLSQNVDEATYQEWYRWKKDWIGNFDPENGTVRPSPIHGWYEGFGEHISTNNGLESMNEKLKCRETFRKKLPLMDFLNTAEAAVFHWSSCPDHQTVATFPTVKKQLFQEAAVLYEEGRLIMKMTDGSYIMPSKQFWPCSPEELQTARRNLSERTYRDWDRFIKLKQSIHIISPSPSIENFYFCSCFSGCKKNPCKHSVLVMHYITKTLVNPYIMSTPIQSKRKRGRPALAKHALSLD